MTALYRAMRESFATTSVTKGILQLVPLILGLTHVYGCVIWYIGTYGQPRSLEELEALNLDSTPHSWVFYYRGMGEENIWADNVCSPPCWFSMNLSSNLYYEMYCHGLLSSW